MPSPWEQERDKDVHTSCANVATSAMRQEKEIKGTWITKKERKLPKFADDIILLIKKIQHNLQKNSILINEFNKCTGHKKNTWKSIAFLCNNNEDVDTKLITQYYSQLLKN